MEIGYKTGLLTLIRIMPASSGNSYHAQGEFECECGKKIIRFIFGMAKPSVNPRSCGCYRRAKAKGSGKRAISHGFSNDLAKKFYLGRL